jgi:hypothetical protein
VHGVVPGTQGYAEQAQELIARASQCGLACVLNVRTESSGAINRAAGVTWTRLAFGWAGTARHSPLDAA